VQAEMVRDGAWYTAAASRHRSCGLPGTQALRTWTPQTLPVTADVHQLRRPHRTWDAEWIRNSVV